MVRTKFKGRYYQVVFTDHSRLQMSLRGLTESVVLEVIQNGQVKPKELKNRYWIYLAIPSRSDNLIALSVVIERPRMIVVTAMVNWRPV